MTDNLVTLATFPTATEAGFVRNLLEGEGIRAYTADDRVVTTLCGNTLGWVKVDVAASDLPRASELLAEHRQAVEDLDEEEFAAEAIAAEDPAVERSANSEPEKSTSDPQDEIAARAVRAAGIGLVCFPVAFYAVWLIGRLVFSKSELSDTASRRMWSAFALTGFIFSIYYIILFRL